jgi:ArsR family transcriptional regulator
MASDLRALVDQLKAVSHPLRLRVLSLLAAGELCVCQVAEALEVPMSSASEALRELKRAGFVKERREGRWVFVSMVPEAEASPFLKGLVDEVNHLAVVIEDRRRAGVVRTLSVPEVCCKVQTATSGEVARV